MALVGLEWLDARGILEGRIMARRFPAQAFAPRVHPRVRMPDIYPLFARALLEEQATRKLDYQAFFGELWPEVQAAQAG